MRASRVALDGITLAVGECSSPREAGADRTVVCIHGLSADHAGWASVAGVLSAEYRVIAYDLRGRGDKSDTGYGLEAPGDDLARLLDHYGLDRAIGAGHSLGP